MSQNYNADVYALSMVISTSMQRIEDDLAALLSSFSGPGAPSVTAAGQPWLDTTNHLLKVRNETDTGWITIWDMTNSTFADMFADSLSALDGSRGDITVSGSGLVWTIPDETIDVAKLAEYAAGNYPICMSVAEATTTSTSYAKVKEIYVARGGVVRVKFQGKKTSANSKLARIYVNGVATGTAQTLTTNYLTYTEDINVSAKDAVQIYAQGDSAEESTIKEFGIYTASLEQTCSTM